MTSDNDTLNITILTASDVPNFSNIDLLEMDNTDDQLIVDILTQTEKTLTNNDNSGTVTNIEQNYNNRQMPIIPKMYFPNSNVTINYNFVNKDEKLNILPIHLVDHLLNLTQRHYLVLLHNVIKFKNIYQQFPHVFVIVIKL